MRIGPGARSTCSGDSGPGREKCMMENEVLLRTTNSSFSTQYIIQRRVDARSGQVKVALRDSVPKLLSHAISSTIHYCNEIYSLGHVHKKKNIVKPELRRFSSTLIQEGNDHLCTTVHTS